MGRLCVREGRSNNCLCDSEYGTSSDVKTLESSMKYQKYLKINIREVFLFWVEVVHLCFMFRRIAPLASEAETLVLFHSCTVHLDRARSEPVGSR